MSATRPAATASTGRRWRPPPSTATRTSDVGPVMGEVDRVVGHGGPEVARVLAAALGEGRIYDKPRTPPAELAARRAFDPPSLPEPSDLAGALGALLGSPTIACKEWAYRQY